MSKWIYAYDYNIQVIAWATQKCARDLYVSMSKRLNVILWISHDKTYYDKFSKNIEKIYQRGINYYGY